ncbi:hypothetical protein [Bifidobacterium saguinibicoloris]|uniref:hypothetical protein n=1 Tax=Bifidobacterium saguinibicoloris TaxID=2834433 RepID=UPI001C56015F|nr:hypothetical protein [Bifidobacterium saguinibicoloris]MBW3081283.1 hypothetical protein [Bifidobacterium saguinibicoloris]
MSAEERRNATPTDAARRARRHAVVMRGVVTPLFGLLAVAAFAVGALNATIWQPSRVIDATAAVTGSRYVLTDPDVLGLVDDNVKVAVQAKGGDDVCVALASAKDAAGWLSGASYTRLTGLSDWSTFAVAKEKSGTKAQTSDADVAFKDSDMWRKVACGAGKATLTAKATSEHDVALVDLGAAGASGTVSFTWTRQTLPDYATPMYFIGGLLAVLAVLTATVFAMPPHKRRKRIVESSGATQAEAQAEQEEVSFGEAVAGSLGGIKPSFAPKGRRRRRHAAGANPPQPVGDQPVVVDPGARNLVADAAGTNQPAGDAGASAAYDDAEATSVISTDELQAYFARLAQEVGDGDTNDTTNGDEEGANR